MWLRVCALTTKGSQIRATQKKLPSHLFYDCHNPNVTHSPHVHWPGSYVHLGQPFPESIKEAAELKETGAENGGAKSLTASTMTVAVSESNPVFWRGQPLKIWQSHKQHRAFTKGKNRPLTRLQTEAKKVYKQLAAHRQQRKKLPEAPTGFQWVKNWGKLNELLLWESCMIILVYQTKKKNRKSWVRVEISDLSYRHWNVSSFLHFSYQPSWSHSISIQPQEPWGKAMLESETLVWARQSGTAGPGLEQI